VTFVPFCSIGGSCSSKDIHRHRRTISMSGINPDGSLKKFPVPTPSTPASIAACEGDIPALSTASSLWDQDEGSGNVPLIWAADRGQSEALKLILTSASEAAEWRQEGSKDPCDVNHKGYLGNTALSRAARGGHEECVALLLAAKGIDPNICNDKMQYPLHFAAFKKHPKVVRAMLDSGLCDTMVKDRKGRTPAEDTSSEEIRSMILEHRKKA